MSSSQAWCANSDAGNISVNRENLIQIHLQLLSYHADRHANKAVIELTIMYLLPSWGKSELHFIELNSYDFITLFVLLYFITSYLLRDAMRKRSLCCDRLSVTFMHSIQIAENSVKLLCQPSSSVILVF